MKFRTISLLALCGCVGSGWGAAARDELLEGGAVRLRITIAPTTATIDNGTITFNEDPSEVWNAPGSGISSTIDAVDSLNIVVGSPIAASAQTLPLDTYKEGIAHLNFMVRPEGDGITYGEESLRSGWELSKKAQSIKFGTSEIEAAWKAVFAKFEAGEIPAAVTGAKTESE